MGKSRPYIDRKQASSYNLVYRNAEAGEDTTDRQWVDTNRGVGVGRPDAEAVQQHEAAAPRAPHIPRWFQNEVDDISEDRRKELIELGFPDDGYDYLKHLRVLGRGQASLETPGASNEAGPSTFVPAVSTQKPDEDRKAYDARQLVLHQAAQDVVEAAQSAGGVSAFSKELAKLHKPTQADIDELERLVSYYQDIEEDEEEQGDLLDDFVLSATLAPPVVTSSTPEDIGEAHDADSAAASEATSEADDSDVGSEASSSEAISEEIISRLGSHASAGPRKLGSIASTYWRPERLDRKENLSVIDERFEAMAIEYDSDDIGELDEDDPNDAKETATVDQFGSLLDEFLEQHPTQDHNHEAGYAYDAAGASADSQSTALNRAAIAKTRELLRRAEEEEARQAPEQPTTSAGRQYHDEPEQRWDCESVLSLRSNLDNHPGVISEQSTRRYRPVGGKIKLAAKTGLPTTGSEKPETLDFDSYSRTTSASAAQPRQKGESTEERKQRKAAVKDAKREARSAKKELKTMFKEEAGKQHKRMANPPSSVIALS